MSVGGFLWTLWAQGWVLYILKYKFVLDIYCQHFGNIIHLKLYIKRWMCALWAQGSVTYIFYMYIFILDKSCQHLGNTCPLNLYTGIGSILLTIGGYMSVGEFLPQGPTVRGPTVHFFRMDNWAPDSWALGQKPSDWHISSSSWQDISNTSIWIQRTCIPQMLASNMNIKI